MSRSNQSHIKSRADSFSLSSLEKFVVDSDRWDGVGTKSSAALRNQVKKLVAQLGEARSNKGTITAEETFLASVFARPELVPPANANLKAATLADAEKATRLIYIYGLANETFGDKKLARDFMMRKHPKLKATPLAKLETEWGGREVEEILRSIMFGLPY